MDSITRVKMNTECIDQKKAGRIMYNVQTAGQKQKHYANGQTERGTNGRGKAFRMASKVTRDGLKKKLEGLQGNWEGFKGWRGPHAEPTDGHTLLYVFNFRKNS